MNDSVRQLAPPEPRQHGAHRVLRRVLLWSGLAAAVLVAAFVIAGNIVLHRAEPILKAKVVETLSNRFDCQVELDKFHVSVVKGFEVTGAGLRLYPRHIDGGHPLFRVEKFSFHVLDWRQLFRSPIFVNRVQVTGLDIDLPPKAKRAAQMPRVHSDARNGDIKVVVGEIVVRRAALLIENGNPEKDPMHFAIDNVELKSVGAGRPMHFRTRLINPKPVGNIDSSGDFGPFNEESPGDTPVTGNYSFRHADLNTIKGLGGMLSSDGQYQGQLDHLIVDGETQTPNFSLDTANRPVPLNTKFHAIVDGTNGNTYLQPVDAWLLHTHIVARGDVVRNAGAPGSEVRLDVTVQPGRIQDLLELATKAQPPLLTGGVILHTNFLLPPGSASVTQRLQLSGYFALENAHFTSAKIQQKVDELSLRGQGKPGEAKREKQAMQSGNANDANPANVASQMRGNFKLSHARLALPTLNYLVPGAKIALSGAYSLDSEALDFHGTAKLDAHVSQMVTGWKSWLLKPVDPFFAKDGAGAEFPIEVTGTRSDPHIGVKLH